MATARRPEGAAASAADVSERKAAPACRMRIVAALALSLRFRIPSSPRGARHGLHAQQRCFARVTRGPTRHCTKTVLPALGRCRHQKRCAPARCLTPARAEASALMAQQPGASSVQASRPHGVRTSARATVALPLAQLAPRRTLTRAARRLRPARHAHGAAACRANERTSRRPSHVRSECVPEQGSHRTRGGAFGRAFAPSRRMRARHAHDFAKLSALRRNSRNAVALASLVPCQAR